MSNAQAPGRTFQVAHRAPGEAPAVAAGTIAIAADHQISIVAAEADFADLLELAADTLNDSEVFMVRAAPAADAKPLTLTKRRVKRTDPDAGEAVIELLRRNYGFELTPAE